MSNSMSRETWDIADENTKLGYLFDLTLDTNKRIKRLENRKRIDSALAIGAGFIGGASAVLAKIAIWK